MDILKILKLVLIEEKLLTPNFSSRRRNQTCWRCGETGLKLPKKTCTPGSRLFLFGPFCSRREIANSKLLIEKKKSDLLEMWGDRLEAAEKNLYTWLEIIPVRTLLFKKCEMMPMMTKLSRLALSREDKIGASVCQRIFQELENQLNEAVEAKKVLQIDIEDD